MVFRPFIKVESLSAKEFRQQKVSILDHTAVIFTSRHAIDHFFTLCGELRVTIPETMKYFCTSEQIALYIQKYVQYRKRKVFFGSTGKIDDIIPLMIKHKNEKYYRQYLKQHQQIKSEKLRKFSEYGFEEKSKGRLSVFFYRAFSVAVHIK